METDEESAPLRQVQVNMADLIDAFENDVEEVSAFLDLETGEVTYVTGEVRGELETIYAELSDAPDDDEGYRAAVIAAVAPKPADLDARCNPGSRSCRKRLWRPIHPRAAPGLARELRGYGGVHRDRHESTCEASACLCDQGPGRLLPLQGCAHQCPGRARAMVRLSSGLNAQTGAGMAGR